MSKLSTLLLMLLQFFLINSQLQTKKNTRSIFVRKIFLSFYRVLPTVCRTMKSSSPPKNSDTP